MNDYNKCIMEPLTVKFPWIQHFFSLPNGKLLFPSSIALQKLLADALDAGKYFLSGIDCKEYNVQSNVLKPLEKIIMYPEVSLDSSEHLPLMEEGTCCATPAIEDIHVTCLGTGAAIPGKYRNVSSTLIESAGGNIFLDCGEGTIGQVYRLFGSLHAANDVLKRTRMILLSHMHGDHHLGTISLLSQITRLSDEKVYVIAPERFRTWFTEISQVCEFGWNGGKIVFVSCSDIRAGVEDTSMPTLPFKVQAIDVDHCFDAFGFSVYFEKEGKIVYSGDTRPCENLVNHAMACEMLIHEATLSNDLQHEAVMRKHCTISEAIDVGLAANAKRILLTHFSQRYAKGALALSNEYSGRVALAVDLLRIPLNEFEQVAKLTEMLPALLPVDEEDSEAE